MIRVYRRVGKNTGVSMPLWLAFVFGIVWLSVAAVLVVVALAVAVVFLLVSLFAGVVGRRRARGGPRPPRRNGPRRRVRDRAMMWLPWLAVGASIGAYFAGRFLWV